MHVLPYQSQTGPQCRIWEPVLGQQLESSQTPLVDIHYPGRSSSSPSHLPIGGLLRPINHLPTFKLERRHIQNTFFLYRYPFSIPTVIYNDVLILLLQLILHVSRHLSRYLLPEFQKNKSIHQPQVAKGTITRLLMKAIAGLCFVAICIPSWKE